MNTIKISKTDDILTLSLHQEYQLQGDEVYIKKIGNVVILISKDEPWQALIQSLNLCTTDFMESREQADPPDQAASFKRGLV